MSIKTLDLAALTAQTGNIYETVAILSKRARQVAAYERAELDERLAYFEGFGPEMEDARMVDEQIRTSLEFERRVKPTQTAVNEMIDHDLFFRHADDPV